MDYNRVKNKTHTPYTIFIVEDDEGLSRLIQKNLKSAGFQTARASNGAEAITWLNENPTTLLLLDYRLPDISGKKLVETLNERHYGVPFIIMTGHGDEKVAVEMMKLGARDYLVKDAEFIAMLPSVVKRVVEQLEVERRLNEAEEELKKSEERYHNLVEFANVGIITTEDSKITQVNRRAEEIYGYSKKELIGQSPNILTMNKYKKQHREMLNEILRCGKAEKTIFEEEGVKKNGSLFPIEISFSLTREEENMVIAVIRDITERKEMEHKLLQSEKLKSLGELAGGVAHDFNNVLAAILGRVQLMRMIMKAPQGERERRKSMIEIKKSLKVVEKAALDGAETVRRILEFSRRTEDDRHFTEVDLNKVIDDALEFTKVRWKDEAEAKGIKIQIKKELFPPSLISGSTSELREVFTNLINNAIDAMPQGGNINIKTFREDSHIITKIKDTGIGIPKAIRDRVFDPFFTTKGVQSTGLGLSISYGVITRHRGTITVDSVEGRGTTFNIQFPLSEKAIEEKRVKPKQDKQRKASILVIEDEKDVGQLLSDILITGGHKVIVVSSGEKGIELFHRKRFDLVFTDLGMPGISGWQVAKEIKKIDGKTPVALITGWQVHLKHYEMEKSGVDLIVTKPFQVEQVLRLAQEGMEIKDRLKSI